MPSMIHYHGTPIGGSRVDVIRFLRGRHALVPFIRQDDVAAVAEVCQSFVFDNSAFSAWLQQKPILDWTGYYEWVDRWRLHPGFDWALIPDVIDGDEAQNDALLRDWPRNLPGVPVWHLHESLYRLARLCAGYRVVAIGSSGTWRTPNTAAWWARMDEALTFICDEHGRPPCKLHGLRMLNPKVFSRLPLTSADSTNAAVNCGAKDRFGWYVPVTSSQRADVIAERIESENSSAVWAGVPQ